MFGRSVAGRTEFGTWRRTVQEVKRAGDQPKQRQEGDDVCGITHDVPDVPGIDNGCGEVLDVVARGFRDELVDAEDVPARQSVSNRLPTAAGEQRHRREELPH